MVPLGWLPIHCGAVQTLQPLPHSFARSAHEVPATPASGLFFTSAQPTIVRPLVTPTVKSWSTVPSAHRHSDWGLPFPGPVQSALHTPQGSVCPSSHLSPSSCV